MLLADRSEGLLVGSLLPVPRQCETLIAAGLASQHKSRVCPPICSRCQTLGWRKEIKLRGNVYSTTPLHQTLSGEGVHRSEVVNIIGCWQKRCAFIPGRGKHLRSMYGPSSVIIGLHPASTVASMPLIFGPRLSRLSSVDRCWAMSRNKQSSWRTWNVILGAARVPCSVCILDRFASANR